ncbi:MAG: hypothetical protein JWO38_6976 [Gemmataceae bacterium]|nr:hypothetical protein [Gemmataceae bacterium]
MSNEAVLPSSIRIAARPGEIINQDFVVQAPLPNGSLTATVLGDNSIFRLREFIAIRMVRERLSDEEWMQLPPALRDEAHRWSVTFEEVARADSGTPLPVSPGLHVTGIIDFFPPAGAAPNSYRATLAVDGLRSSRVEVPLLFVVGDIKVEFPAGPIVIHQNHWTPIPVRITLTGAPDTDLTLAVTHGYLEAPSTPVRVLSGYSANATLNMRVDGAPIGPLASNLTITGHSQKLNFVQFTAEVKPPLPPPLTREARLGLASTEIRAFHEAALGILVVGSPVGPTREVANGAYEQRYEFGSILKPLNGPPVYATRYVVTIDIAAIKCFGTDDPSGTDEPYIVVAVYGIDPLVRERAVQTSEIHLGSVEERAIFAQGHPLMPSPMFIPGDGKIQLNISLWEEEAARPAALQEKWRDLATAAILGGLTLLNPQAGAAAASLEAAKGVVTDASRMLIAAVSDFLGLADDHLGTREFSITADFLKRLIADGSGLPRTSPSIPGIRYNFPELPETPDATGRSWYFEGGGGSYRIFLSVRAAEVTLSPPP